MVTKKPKGLGRGLEALLGPKVAEAVEQAQAQDAGLPSSLRLDDMVPGMYQPRTRMDEGALYELAESIKAQGIMQPILVRMPASLKSSRASAASARPSWPGWTACRCWYATCPTRPPPPWR